MPGLTKSILFGFVSVELIKNPALDSLMQVWVVETGHKSGLMLCVNPE